MYLLIQLIHTRYKGHSQTSLVQLYSCPAATATAVYASKGDTAQTTLPSSSQFVILYNCYLTANGNLLVTSVTTHQVKRAVMLPLLYCRTAHLNCHHQVKGLPSIFHIHHFKLLCTRAIYTNLYYPGGQVSQVRHV